MGCVTVLRLCFGTISTNNGHKAGACILLKLALEHDLLHPACRRHVLELLISAAFQKTLGPTSVPEVLLFKCFNAVELH